MNRVCRKRFSRLHAEGPLAPFQESYSESLADQGFSQISFWKKTFLINEFSRWLNEKKLAVGELAPEHERAFLRDRARYRCPKNGDRIALGGMTRWLRENGVLTREVSYPAEESESQRLLQEYSFYLQHERGLAAATIRQHLWWARRFLTTFYGANQARLASLGTKQIVDFVRCHAPRDRTFSAAKNLTTALR